MKQWFSEDSWKSSSFQGLKAFCISSCAGTFCSVFLGVSSLVSYPPWQAGLCVAGFTFLPLLFLFQHIAKKKSEKNGYDYSKNFLHDMLLNHPGATIIFSVLVGILLLALAIAFFNYKIAKDPNWKAIFEKNPPWYLLSALVALPSVLVTWYWRKTSKDLDLKTSNETVLLDAFGKLDSYENGLFSDDDKVATKSVSGLERIARRFPTLQEHILSLFSDHLERRLYFLSDVLHFEEVSRDATGHRTLKESSHGGVSMVVKHPLDEKFTLDFPPPRGKALPFTFDSCKAIIRSIGQSFWTARKDTVVSFVGKVLAHTNFSGDYSGIDFSKSVLISAIMRKNILSGCNFTNSYMDSAYLHGAHVEGTIFQGTVIRSADLSAAIGLSVDNFIETTKDCKGTRLPNGEYVKDIVHKGESQSKGPSKESAT